MKVQPSQADRKKPAPTPKTRTPPRFTTMGYAAKIRRACDAAFPLPAALAPRRVGTRKEMPPQWWARLTDAEKAAVKAWRLAHRWHPNQLRHSFGTAVREKVGREVSQTLLAHAKADVTQVYAERVKKAAVEAVKAMGCVRQNEPLLSDALQADGPDTGVAVRGVDGGRGSHPRVHRVGEPGCHPTRMTAAEIKQYKDNLYGNPDKRPPRPSWVGSGVPRSLIAVPQWMPWCLTWRVDSGKGRWAKIPLNPHSYRDQAGRMKWAKNNDPTTWGTYETPRRGHCRRSDGPGRPRAAVREGTEAGGGGGPCRAGAVGRDVCRPRPSATRLVRGRGGPPDGGGRRGGRRRGRAARLPRG